MVRDNDAKKRKKAVSNVRVQSLNRTATSEGTCSSSYVTYDCPLVRTLLASEQRCSSDNGYVY